MQRLIQITDMHIHHDPDWRLLEIDTHARLRSVLKVVADQSPDLVWATGDLVEDGSVESYVRLRPTLLELGVPVLVLPGNHDDVSNMREGLLGGRIRMSSKERLGAWHLLSVDSNDADGHGHIGPVRLRELAADLTDTPTLVALHHGPLEPCTFSGCQLHDGSDFAELIDRHPQVRAVLNGHSHTHRDLRRGPTRYLTALATSIGANHPKQPTGDADFWSCHVFQTGSFGFRQLDLCEGGTFKDTSFDLGLQRLL